MANASQVLSIAAGELGYSAPADPLQGSKYGRWMAQATGDSSYAGPSDDMPWCAMFLSWVFAQAGQVFPGMPSASCEVIRDCGIAAGYARNINDLMPGDLVIFDWPGTSLSTDHIGIVESVGATSFTTIEGNTNGGTVCRQARGYGYINSVVRPPYTSSGNGSLNPVSKIAEDGYWGKETTTAFQHHYNLVADGEVWHQWAPNVQANPVLTSGWQCDETQLGSPVIRAIQQNFGITADGLMGPETILTIKELFDGIYGRSEVLDRATVWEIQHQLNNGTWPLHLWK